MSNNDPRSLVDIDLTDPGLFGNDAAEDEDERVFQSYAYEREELGSLTSPKKQICIIRAYKGEGKSALLRLAHGELANQTPEPIIIRRTAPAISPEGHGGTFPKWVRHWKAVLFGVVATELGSRIGVAWSDDAMSLVEEAEKSGARGKSILGSIIDRLPLANVSAGDISLPFSVNRQGTPSAEAVVSRWLEGDHPIHVMVDDVDKNFERSTEQKLRIAAFFEACREAVNAVPELRFRVAVRPNVWTALKVELESLSHAEQYCIDLRWTEAQARGLLARRIEGYLERTEQLESIQSEVPYEEYSKDRFFIGLVFDNSMPWGRSSRPAHVILYTLSKHRPRWMIELARIAATHAVDQDRSFITLPDITKNLKSFGRRRIEDTSAEFRSQCPQIEELITTFNRAPEEMSTDELLALINNRITNHLSPTITGMSRSPSTRDIAAFLFEVGLFFARRDYDDGSYEHFTYSDRPFLLRSRADIDAGMKWEVHPVFRQALEIRD